MRMLPYRGYRKVSLGLPQGYRCALDDDTSNRGSLLGGRETGGGHLPGGRALKGVRFPDGYPTAMEAGGVLSCA